MADIASSDLTYSVDQEKMQMLNGLGKQVIFQLSFGDGALTYPTGGIAIDKAKLGGHFDILSLNVIESNATGYVFEFDVSAQKLRIFEVDTTGDTDKAMVELDGGSDAPAAMVLQINALVR